MRIEGNIMLGTALEIAEHIASGINTENVLQKHFDSYDFAIADETDVNEPLEYIVNNSTGWYGIKAIDAGFDSDNLVIIGDYYGGGSAAIGTLYDGITHDEAACEIARIIKQTLELEESYHADATLIFQSKSW